MLRSMLWAEMSSFSAGSKSLRLRFRAVGETGGMAFGILIW